MIFLIWKKKHKKNRHDKPTNWNQSRVRRYLKRHEPLPSEAERIRMFKEVISHFHPAMRFWFLESQKSPAKWFEMQLNFTRTTATASIVGHILGLGDWHLSNILVDSEKGDMVQIDLGIAFDAVSYHFSLFLILETDGCFWTWYPIILWSYRVAIWRFLRKCHFVWRKM